jgi:hypothetical protein
MTQRHALLFFGALGTVTPVVMFALVLAHAIDPYVASDIAGIGILLGILGTIAAPFLPLQGRGATRRDRLLDLLYLWTWASVMAQLGWEMPFVILSPWLKGATASDRWLFLFWSYGVADTRYLIADPFTVCMEAVTSMVGGPLELYVLYLWKRGRLKTALFWALIISATQFYGTVLFFGIEAYQGFIHVGPGFVNVFIKFFGLNAVWLVMPIVCLYAYFVAIRDGVQNATERLAA